MTAVEKLFKIWLEKEYISPNEWSEALEMEKEQLLEMPPYDLDELAMEECNNPDLSWENDYAKEKFKAGFQKALELLTNKIEQNEK